MDDGVVLELADACAPDDALGFGELTELLGGDDVDGLLASLLQLYHITCNHVAENDKQSATRYN